MPALATWDGGPDGGGTSADDLWTTGTNWVGDVAPQSGDDILFTAVAQLGTANNDFATNTTFRSLTVNAGGYLIFGNPLVVTDGVAVNFNIGGDSSAEIRLTVGGAGGLTKDGNGTLILSAANSYTGVTAVNEGNLLLRDGSALGLAGPGNDTTVAMSAGVGFDENGINVPEAVTLSGSLASLFIPGQFVSATLSGPLTLAANGTIRVDGLLSLLTLAGGVAEAGGARDLTLSGNGEVLFATGTVNAVTGTTTVLGVGTFNGTGPTGLILAGPDAGIQGRGTIGPLQQTVGQFLSPGDTNAGENFGTLTTGNLTLPTDPRSRLQFLFDLAPTASDRLVVNGTVQLGGTLVPSYLFNFTPTPGGRYRLIDNDGTDPVVGNFIRLPEAAVVSAFAPGDQILRITYRGGDGNDVELYADSATTLRRFAVGAGAGGVPVVSVYNANGVFVRSFLAYEEAFRGGVNVAVADINLDGVPDIVTAPGFGGGPVIRIWDGTTGAMVRQFLAYDSAFRGGVNVSTGFVNVGPTPDIITGAGQGGGPHVRAFDGETAAGILSFFAYDINFTGGVSVSGGRGTTVSVGGTVTPGTIITGAGVGGGPHVRVFNSLTGAPTGESFFAYEAAFTGGINVAYTGGSFERIITAPKAGGGPVVRGFTTNGTLVFQFLAFDANFRGGVSVAARPLGSAFNASIITGSGPGIAPNVRVWNETGTALQDSLIPFDPAFLGGVFVG